MVDAFSFEADVPGGPGAARQARELVRRQLAGRVPRGWLGDVALLVTELVANGVRHGGAGADSALKIRFVGRQRALRVEVLDPGSADGAIRPRDPDVLHGGGLGLHLVERIASRWGVGDGPRTSVWFELDCR